MQSNSCIGCEMRKNGKCTIMTVIPKSRMCFVTLDQAIKTETDIINYIDAGSYPVDEALDRFYRTKAYKRLEKLRAKKQSS